VRTNDPKEQANQSGQMFQGSYVLEEIKLDDRPLDEIRRQLDLRIQKRGLDGYIILPPNLTKNEQPEFRARNAADLFTQNYVENSISREVRAQRMVEANIDERAEEKMSEPVNLRTTGAGGEVS